MGPAAHTPLLSVTETIYTVFGGMRTTPPHAHKQIGAHHLCTMVRLIRGPGRRYLDATAPLALHDTEPHPVTGTEPTHSPIEFEDLDAAAIAVRVQRQVLREFFHFHHHQTP